MAWPEELDELGNPFLFPDIPIDTCSDEYILVTKSSDLTIANLDLGLGIFLKNRTFATFKPSCLIYELIDHKLEDLKYLLKIEVGEPISDLDKTVFYYQNLYSPDRVSDTHFIITHKYDFPDIQTFDFLLSSTRSEIIISATTSLLKWSLKNSYGEITDHIMNSGLLYDELQIFSFSLSLGNIPFALDIMNRTNLEENGLSYMMISCRHSCLEIFLNLRDSGVEYDNVCLAVSILNEANSILEYLLDLESNLDQSVVNTIWSSDSQKIFLPYIPYQFGTIQLTDDESPLSLAILCNSHDLAMNFIESGAVVHHQNTILILRAIRNHDVKMVEILVKMGMDISEEVMRITVIIMRNEIRPNLNSFNPPLLILKLITKTASPTAIAFGLKIALELKDLNTIRFFLEYGCGIDTLDNKSIKDITFDARILQLVIDHGLDVKSIPHIEKSPIAYHNLDVLKILLNNGFLAQNMAVEACICGNLPVIKMVFELAMDELLINKLAPHTISKDSDDILDFLIEKGLDLDNDCNRKTLMISALASKAVRIIAYLGDR